MQILASLLRRIDHNTGLVSPEWRKLAQEFGVSFSTVGRQLAKLHKRGFIKRVYVDDATYYRFPGVDLER